MLARNAENVSLRKFVAVCDHQGAHVRALRARGGALSQTRDAARLACWGPLPHQGHKRHDSEQEQQTTLLARGRERHPCHSPIPNLPFVAPGQADIARRYKPGGRSLK